MPARTSRFLLLAAGLAAAAACNRVRAGTDFIDVNVAIEMTHAGAAVVRPTPENPAYYYPIMGGYHELGAPVRDSTPVPTSLEVAQIMARVFAEQGYLVTNAAHPPSLLLNIQWGTLNPIYAASDGTVNGIVSNMDQMLAMMTGGGKAMARMTPGWDGYKRVMQNARIDRYFILVTAYDYAAYQYSGMKEKLWQADITVPARGGVTLEGVLPIMARAAGPSLGYETVDPVSRLTPLPPGHVVLGTAVEVPDKPDDSKPKAP